MATQRVGRYPSLRVGGPSWTGIIMDTNPPDDDSWWYKLAEEDKPPRATSSSGSPAASSRSRTRSRRTSVSTSRTPRRERQEPQGRVRLLLPAARREDRGLHQRLHPRELRHDDARQARVPGVQREAARQRQAAAGDSRTATDPVVRLRPDPGLHLLADECPKGQMVVLKRTRVGGHGHPRVLQRTSCCRSINSEYMHLPHRGRRRPGRYQPIADRREDLLRRTRRSSA
jgi:hypothetical protein